MINKRPEKLQNVLELIKDGIREGKYIFTVHALERQGERTINLPTTLHILKTGYEEKRKTSFDEKNNTWKYAIRGKTIRDEHEYVLLWPFLKMSCSLSL